MRPESYRRIGRILRGIADRLDALAEATDPRQRAAVTRLLHGLARSSRAWSARQRATTDGSLRVPVDRR